MAFSESSFLDKDLPPENVRMGALFSLVIIPVGAAVWVAIWSLGFISALVSFAVAIGAVFLYRKGSGGRVGGAGVAVVGIVVLVTLLVGFFIGLVVDYAKLISEEVDMPFWDVLNHPEFWPSFNLDFPAIIEANGLNLFLSLLFGALGAFSVLRTAFKNRKHGSLPTIAGQAAPDAPAAPITPEAHWTTQLNADSTGTLNEGPDAPKNP